MTDQVTVGTIQMTWAPDARLAALSFSAETHATGHDAEVLLQALGQWLGPDPQPFGLLGDGGKLTGVDPEYRSRWAAFLKQHRSTARIAFFNMGPLIRIAAEMFRIGTGLELKAFADEEGARRWLRDKGIGA